jgi:phosphoribosyl 1,2-cyclic phosphodiesterase
MKITFWGVRGSIPSPGPDTVIYGGNTTCLEIITSADRTIVIDAGSGIRRLGDSLVARERNDILLLMTHIHWDHLLGFPFFAPLFLNHTRIVVDGFRRGLSGLRQVFSTGHLDGTWPVKFEDLKAQIEAGNVLPKNALQLENLTVDSHPLRHPQGGLGFRFRESGRTFVFLTDNELTEDATTSAIRFESFVNFCRDADLLVHDCQYTVDEGFHRKGWGHSDVKSVARLAMAARVKRVVLFHHDPWRNDEGIQDLTASCAEFLAESQHPVEVKAAREGDTLEL